jgi:hypothetical protein
LAIFLTAVLPRQQNREIGMASSEKFDAAAVARRSLLVGKDEIDFELPL